MLIFAICIYRGAYYRDAVGGRTIVCTGFDAVYIISLAHHLHRPSRAYGLLCTLLRYGLLSTIASNSAVVMIRLRILLLLLAASSASSYQLSAIIIASYYY